uniref:Uncharacterized protein n=1 Tax=Arundo donax TaxID=35708 RepID=A0A0A9BQ14_ARUDO
MAGAPRFVSHMALRSGHSCSWR